MTSGLSECELILGEFSGDLTDAAGPQMQSGGSLGIPCLREVFSPNPERIRDD